MLTVPLQRLHNQHLLHSKIGTPGELMAKLVVVQGQDVYQQGLPNAPFARHEDTRNQGMHVIHTGGSCDSHLLIPEIPKA